MNSKTIMTLMLRLMGFWILFHAIGVMVNLVAVLNWSSTPGVQSNTRDIISGGFAIIAYASFAAALLLFAAPIALLFRVEPDSTWASDRITVRDIYLIVARIMGIYSLLSAVPAAQKLVKYTFDSKWQRGLADELAWASLVELCLYVAAGAFLILKASAIATVFAREHGMGQRPDE